MMTRSAKPDHSALLLEGFDDQRFYRNYLHPKCLSFPLDGRLDVLGTLSVLANRGQAGIAGLIDADCDHLNGQACPSNVLRSDFRDLECFLVGSTALGRVLNEHLIADPVGEVRGRLLNACRDLGLLRWQVWMHGWHVDFKHLDYTRFIDAVTLAANRVNLCREVLRQNPGFAITEQELLDAIQLADGPGYHLLNVCSGHDLTAVLAIWISRRGNIGITAWDVEQQLRLALDLGSFARAGLVRQVREWEASNVPFRILKDFVQVKLAGGPVPI